MNAIILHYIHYSHKSLWKFFRYMPEFIVLFKKILFLLSNKAGKFSNICSIVAFLIVLFQKKLNFCFNAKQESLITLYLF